MKAIMLYTSNRWHQKCVNKSGYLALLYSNLSSHNLKIILNINSILTNIKRQWNWILKQYYQLFLC